MFSRSLILMIVIRFLCVIWIQWHRLFYNHQHMFNSLIYFSLSHTISAEWYFKKKFCERSIVICGELQFAFTNVADKSRSRIYSYFSSANLRVRKKNHQNPIDAKIILNQTQKSFYMFHNVEYSDKYLGKLSDTFYFSTNLCDLWT
jgi:hypothetical protein